MTPPVWKPQPIEVYQSWINQLMEVSEELTQWETNFVENISDRLDRGSNLTERQAEILEKIYVEKTK